LFIWKETYKTEECRGLKIQDRVVMQTHIFFSNDLLHDEQFLCLSVVNREILCKFQVVYLCIFVRILSEYFNISFFVSGNLLIPTQYLVVAIKAEKKCA
jgi:hypothetical protein